MHTCTAQLESLDNGIKQAKGCLTRLALQLQTGDRLTSGDIYANVHENSLLDHRIMVPPGAKGNVTYIAPAGEYSLEDKVLELEFGGVKKVRTLSWATTRASHFQTLLTCLYVDTWLSWSCSQSLPLLVLSTQSSSTSLLAAEAFHTK